jgi:hypothetical protein
MWPRAALFLEVAMHSARPILLSLLLVVVIASAAVAARLAAPLGAQSAQIIDIQRRLDINQLNMWATNYGSIAWDLSTGGSGLEFPKGSGKTAVFAGGLWLGARVGGQVRTVVAEYSQEYVPGPMVGGTFANPSFPQFRVYKVLPWTGDPADTAHVERNAPGPLEDPRAHDSWSEYLNGAAPYGAPVQTWLLPDPNNPGDTVPVPGPADLGDQILWAVFNDADPANHTNDAGGSPPLGVEIQQMTLGATHTTAAQNAAIIRYRIINKGTQQLDDVIVTLWTDPDLGGASDDLVGYDPGLEMVYAYNATNNDPIYGATPPAVGVMLLQGPTNAFGDSIPVSAATMFINGTDPSSADESYNYMRGLLSNGSPVIHPSTGLPTTFWFDGDPVQGTGWLDTNPADRRMMLSAGMFSMAAGDTQEVVFAIVLGQGANRLASITALRMNAVQLKGGSVPPPPPPLTNCPRPAAYWATQCPPSSGDLTPAQLDSITRFAGGLSLYFDWPAGTETASFCSAINPPGPLDARSMARTEFAALLANFSAGVLGVVPAGGQPIRLLTGMPVNCPGIEAVDIVGLVSTATSDPTLGADYVNDNPANPTALAPVNYGGAAFGGGADFGFDFWGGTLEPFSSPDSFPDVELRFSNAAPQQAYRYLRLEQSDGSAPAGGREYRYGGHHTVPFQVWDTENNVQLDVAFFERTVTDAAGTILAPAMQVASFDSTWGPTAESLGGREYLFVLSRPYSPVPKAEFMVDAAMDNSPILYAVWSRRTEPGAVIDDGDRFTFLMPPYSGPGIDTQLLLLEEQPLSDPAVLQAYNQIIGCLRDINTGVTIQDPCDEATAIQLSLLAAEAELDRVSLTWYTAALALAVTVERREEAGQWAAVAQAFPDGSGMIRYVDTGIVPGGRYDYRLAFMDDGVLTRAGEASVVVPLRLALALSGFVPNPARGLATVEFVLPARAPATLEVLDLQGRRLVVREVGQLGPGRARVTLEGGVKLNPGIYVVRLKQGGVSASRKAVVVR